MDFDRPYRQKILKTQKARCPPSPPTPAHHCAPQSRRRRRRRRRRHSIYRKTKPGQFALYCMPLSHYKVLSEDQLPCVRDIWARAADAAACLRRTPPSLPSHRRRDDIAGGSFDGWREVTHVHKMCQQYPARLLA